MTKRYNPHPQPIKKLKGFLRGMDTTIEREDDRFEAITMDMEKIKSMIAEIEDIDLIDEIVNACRINAIERIRRAGSLRQIRGWTGINNGNLSQYLNEKKHVSTETLIKIAKQIRDNKNKMNPDET
ncbi:hypothetical protein [Leptospira noguchii]|nr:hypothetical protein [Leptospira noguchii]